MSDQLTLSAETRERAGKGASRAMRREGRVPAVIYGEKKEPLAIHVEEKALVKMLSTGHFMNSVVMVDVGGKATRTLPKDVQFHPVNDRPLILKPAPTPVVIDLKDRRHLRRALRPDQRDLRPDGLHDRRPLEPHRHQVGERQGPGRRRR